MTTDKMKPSSTPSSSSSSSSSSATAAAGGGGGGVTPTTTAFSPTSSPLFDDSLGLEYLTVRNCDQYGVSDEEVFNLACLQYERDLASQSKSGPWTFNAEHRETNKKVFQQILDLIPLCRYDCNQTSDCDTIYRSLIAKRFDVASTVTALRDYISWRRANNIDVVLHKKLSNELLQACPKFRGFGKKEMGSYPVNYNKPDPKLISTLLDKFDKQDLISIYYRQMESCRRIGVATGTDRMITVMDLGDLGINILSNMKGVSVIKEAAAQLQHHYPEQQKVILCANGGWVFSAGFALISPLLDKRVKDKIRNISDPKAIKEFIDLSEVSPIYGGTGKANVDPHETLLECFDGEVDPGTPPKRPGGTRCELPILIEYVESKRAEMREQKEQFEREQKQKEIEEKERRKKEQDIKKKAAENNVSDDVTEPDPRPPTTGTCNQQQQQQQISREGSLASAESGDLESLLVNDENNNNESAGSPAIVIQQNRDDDDDDDDEQNNNEPFQQGAEEGKREQSASSSSQSRSKRVLLPYATHLAATNNTITSNAVTPTGTSAVGKLKDDNLEPQKHAVTEVDPFLVDHVRHTGSNTPFRQGSVLPEELRTTPRARSNQQQQPNPNSTSSSSSSSSSSPQKQHETTVKSSKPAPLSVSTFSKFGNLTSGSSMFSFKGKSAFATAAHSLMNSIEMPKKCVHLYLRHIVESTAIPETVITSRIEYFKRATPGTSSTHNLSPQQSIPTPTRSGAAAAADKFPQATNSSNSLSQSAEREQQREKEREEQQSKDENYSPNPSEPIRAPHIIATLPKGFSMFTKIGLKILTRQTSEEKQQAEQQQQLPQDLLSASTTNASYSLNNNNNQSFTFNASTAFAREQQKLHAHNQQRASPGHSVGSPVGFKFASSTNNNNNNNNNTVSAFAAASGTLTGTGTGLLSSSSSLVNNSNNALASSSSSSSPAAAAPNRGVSVASTTTTLAGTERGEVVCLAETVAEAGLLSIRRTLLVLDEKKKVHFILERGAVQNEIRVYRPTGGLLPQVREKKMQFKGPTDRLLFAKIFPSTTNQETIASGGSGGGGWIAVKINLEDETKEKVQPEEGNNNSVMASAGGSGGDGASSPSFSSPQPATVSPPAAQLSILKKLQKQWEQIRQPVPVLVIARCSQFDVARAGTDVASSLFQVPRAHTWEKSKGMIEKRKGAAWPILREVSFENEFLSSPASVLAAFCLAVDALFLQNKA